MSRRTLSSTPGLSTEIGFCLNAMDEVRDQLREAVAGMADEQISRPAIPGAHSIAALVLHIGEAEWYWMQNVVSGHQVTDEIRNAPFWDVLKEPKLSSKQSYSTEFCLNEIKRIRQQAKGEWGLVLSCAAEHLNEFLKSRTHDGPTAT